MKASENRVPTGLDRVNSLLAWWDVPRLIGASGMEAHAERFRLVLDLTKFANEAFSSQAQALSAGNEQFGRALRELLSARQPPELMAAQSSLLTALMENLVAQTRLWAELTQKFYECCSAVTCEAASETGEHTRRPEPAVKGPETKRPERRSTPRVDQQSEHLDHAHG